MINLALRRKRSASGLTGAILAFIGILFLMASIVIVSITQLSLAGTVTAQGTILACIDQPGSCEPTVSFRTLTGQRITFHSSISSSTFTPGDTVTVRYHPDHPQDAQIDPWLLSSLLAWIFGGVGALLAIVGLLIYLFAKDSQSAILVDSYFTAFKNQDYVTAFQYLNPNMQNPQGQQVTLDWFAQRVQEYDTTSGVITNARIAGFSLNGPQARYTVKVTRGMRTYRIHLNLLKQGDAWSILGFDLF